MSVEFSKPVHCYLICFMCAPPSGQSGTWTVIYPEFNSQTLLWCLNSIHACAVRRWTQESKTTFLSSFLLSVSIVLSLELPFSVLLSEDWYFSYPHVATHFPLLCLCPEPSFRTTERGRKNGSLSHPLGIIGVLIGECDKLNNSPPKSPGPSSWNLHVACVCGIVVINAHVLKCQVYYLLLSENIFI